MLKDTSLRAGAVALDEVDSRTMESKIVEGLRRWRFDTWSKPLKPSLFDNLTEEE